MISFVYSLLPMYVAKYIHHRKAVRIAVQFENDARLIARFKKLKGAKWSASLKVWHLPNLDIYRTLFKLAEQKENVKQLPEEQAKQLGTFQNWLTSKRYSNSTIKTYKEAVRIFMLFFPDKKPADFTNSDIIYFNNEYILKNKLSASYQNQVVNAIKLFFNIVQDKQVNIAKIHRPKKAKTLPNVLSKEEVKAILEVGSNLKHKVMLSLIVVYAVANCWRLNLLILTRTGMWYCLKMQKVKKTGLFL